MTRSQYSYAPWARRRRAGRVVLVVLALLIAGYTAFTFPARLQLYDETMRLTSDRHSFEQIQWVHNAGPMTQTVTGVTSSQRGVVMTGTDAVGRRIAPGRTARIVVSYRVIDCHLVLHGPYPRGGPFAVRLGLRRWWGDAPATLLDRGVGFTGDAYDACLPHRASASRTRHRAPRHPGVE